MTVQRRKIEREKNEKKTNYSIFFLAFTSFIIFSIGAVFYVTSTPNIDMFQGVI